MDSPVHTEGFVLQWEKWHFATALVWWFYVQVRSRLTVCLGEIEPAFGRLVTKLCFGCKDSIEET